MIAFSKRSLEEKNRQFKAAFNRLTTYTATMNQHQLKDEINRTYREVHEYYSDFTTETEPVRKEFLDKKVKELSTKYELLTGRKVNILTST